MAAKEKAAADAAAAAAAAEAAAGEAPPAEGFEGVFSVLLLRLPMFLCCQDEVLRGVRGVYRAVGCRAASKRQACG